MSGNATNQDLPAYRQWLGVYGAASQRIKWCGDALAEIL